MDRLKKSLSRSKNDEPQAEETQASPTSGKVTGPGSHFASAKQTSTLGSTSGGAETEGSALPTTTSSTIPDTSMAQSTSGTDPGFEQSSAAIGQTTTYSSTPLASGDPTSSVIDSGSKDPVTYQKPEAAYVSPETTQSSNTTGVPETSYSSNTTGVPEGAATVAASKAFSKPREDMPGSFPSQDAPTSTSSTTQSAGLGSGAATGLAAGSATADAAGNTTSSANAPSTLTSTTSPGERHPGYAGTETSKGLDATDTGAGQQSGMVGRVLGAVGLGSLAGAGVAKATSNDKDTAVADAPDQPTTTTGISFSTVPQQSGPPPSHHRKESIPTTAYPGGPGSPRAVAPPIGGTQRPAVTDEPTSTHDSSRGKDAALGAAAVGGAGALGAGAYASRDRDVDKSVTHDVPTTTTYDAVTSSTHDSRATPATTTVDRETPVPTSVTQPEREDHTGRNLAAGTAAGAGVLGAGAYAARDRDEGKAVTDTAPTSGGNLADRSEKPTTSGTYGSPSVQREAPTSSTTAAEPRQEDHTGRNVATGTAAGVGAVGAGAYAGNESSQRQAPTSSTTAGEPEKEDHTGRNVTGTAAGVGAVGAGAYTAHEYSQRHEEEEAAKRAQQQKDLEAQQKTNEKAAAKQEKEHQKEVEKQEKAQEKAAAKEENQHQKEIEKQEKAQEKAAAKEEKQHEKEVEKEEKKRQKELGEEEKRREKAGPAAAIGTEGNEEDLIEQRRLANEEEYRRKREEIAAASGVGAVAAGAGAYGASKHDAAGKDTTDGGTVEKKPSLLRRIFKRTRKNKDTGEDEEYEEEGDEHGHDSHKGAAAATAGVGAAGAGAAHYGTRDNDKSTATTGTTGATDTTQGETSYEAASGGMQKPSYNPFKAPYHDTEGGPVNTPSKTTDDVAHGTTTSRAVDEPTTTTTTSRTADEGLAPTAAPRAPGESAPSADSSGIPIRESRDESGKPIEPITGLAYDPSKDPEAAKRIEERNYAGADLMQDAQAVKQDRLEGGETRDDVVGSEEGEKKKGFFSLKEKLLPGSGSKTE